MKAAHAFTPHSYEIELESSGNHSFVSVTTIKGHKNKPSHRFTFKVNGLKLVSAQVSRHQKGQIDDVSVTRTNHHRKFEEVRIHTEAILYPGEYTIQMTARGVLNDTVRELIEKLSMADDSYQPDASLALLSPYIDCDEPVTINFNKKSDA